MALPHAAPGDAINTAPLGAALTSTPTSTLIKTAEIQVIRVVLVRNAALPPHKVPGPITIQCLEGCVTVTHQESTQLKPGQMLVLEGGQEHAVQAHDDASLLLTIVLRPAH